MLSFNGRIRLTRTRWYCPHDGSESLTDALLDAVEATISEGVREMACRVNQSASSFQNATDVLRRTAHLTVSKGTLRTLVESEGKDIVRQMRSGDVTPDLSADDC